MVLTKEPAEARVQVLVAALVAALDEEPLEHVLVEPLLRTHKGLHLLAKKQLLPKSHTVLFFRAAPGVARHS